jgi:hypothetical protein
LGKPLASKLLQEFRYDRLLSLQGGFQGCQTQLLGAFLRAFASAGLKGSFGLVEQLFHPEVDLARLDGELLGQVGNRLLSGQVPSHYGCFLLGREVPAFVHESISNQVSLTRPADIPIP